MAGAVLARRMIQAFIALFVLASVLFFVPRVFGVACLVFVDGFYPSDGDCFLLAEYHSLHPDYAPDTPMIVQYARFVGGILHGDLGDSALGSLSARDLVIGRIGVSLQLVVPAFILGLGIAIPLGSIAAVKRGAIGAVAMMLALIFHSVPSFFLGVLYIFLFGVTLDWLPVYGSGGVEHFILPVAALMAYPLARYTRLIRAQVAETLTQAYVQTARAKGLAETRVLRRHVMRIALLPIVTVMGVDIGTLVVDAVVVEVVFGWPGFGAMVVEAVEYRDYPVIQAASLTIALLVLTSSLVADFVHGLIDPRIRRTS